MQFDLLVKGGHVLDPGSGYDGRMDVAVKRNRIAAVEPDIPESTAFRVVDATNQFVVPGLIDMHAHVYEGVGYWGINPDAVGSRSGVTTWADAGSAGALTLPGFKQYIVDQRKTRIYSFVNISCTGLIAQNYELSLNEYCSVDLLKRVVPRYSDIVAGIKVRAGTSGGGQDLVPFERARRAADELGLPIMVHISSMPPTLKEVLSFLKAGDIVTHAYTGQDMRVIDASGKVLPEVREALDRGVLLDMGHGAGSLAFHTAEACIAQGVLLDVISTDLHFLALVGSNLVMDDPERGLVFANRESKDDAASVVVNVKGKGEPTFSLLTCLDKMMALGMSFKGVLERVTCRPAEILGLSGEVGTLRPGARADIAGLVVEDKEVELWDIHKQMRLGKQHVRNTFTVLDGKQLEPMPIPPLAPWVQPVG